MGEELTNFFKKLNFKIILLSLLFIILFSRFGIKMLNGYLSWDYFHHYFAAQNIFTDNNIYADSYMGARFTRSPFFALLIYPLGLLPRNISAFFWSLMIIASLISIFLICEKLFLKNKNKYLFYWLFIAPLTLFFLSKLLISEFLMGQSNLIMLCLIMLALLFKEKNKLVFSALFFVLAINIKLTPLLFIPYFLIKKEFKLVALITVFMIVSLLLPAVLISWDRNFQLLSNWKGTLGYYDSVYNSTQFESCFGTQSLFIFFKRFLFGDNYKLSLFHASPKFAKYLSYLVLLAVYSSFLFFKPKNNLKNEKTFLFIDYNILILCLALFSPLSADHTYMNMIVPIIFLLFYYNNEKLYKLPSFYIPAFMFFIFNIFTSTKMFRLVGIRHIQGESYTYFVVMTVVWQALILLYLLFLLKHKINKKLIEEV